MPEEEQAPQTASNEAHESSGKSAEQEPPRKKRRRWLRVLIGLVLVLVILTAAAPYLLSTGPGTKLVVWIASSRIDGRVEIADLSLSWGGPCRIEGLAIHDRENREVLGTELLYWSRGIWHGITQWENFDEVRIEDLLVALYMQEDGKTSLQEVFAKYLEKEEEPDEKLQERVQSLRGTLTLKNGRIRVVALDGREMRYEQLNLNCEVRTLADLKAALSLSAPDLPTPTSGPASRPSKPQTASGALTLEISLSRSDPKAPIVLGVDGLLEVEERNGKPADYSPVELKLVGLEYAGGASLVKLKSLLLRSGTLLSLTVNDARASLSEDMSVEGTLRLEADVARCLASAAPIAGWDKPPAIAGKLLWTARAQTKGKGFDVQGDGRVDKLQIGTGKEAVREEKVELKLVGLEYAGGASLVKLKSLLLRSGTLLSLTVDDARASLSEDMSVEGTLRLEADVARCLASAAPIAGWDKPPAIAGKLLWTAKAQTTGEASRVEGTCRISALQIGAGKKADPKGAAKAAGRLDLTMSLSKSDRAGPLVLAADGLMKVLDPASGKEADYSPIKLKVERLEYASETSLVKLKSLLVQAGTFLSLTASETRANLSDDFSMDGTLKLQADIARCLASAAPLAGWKEPPAIAGQLVWTAKAQTTGKQSRIDGSCRVDRLKVGTGKEAFEEAKPVTLAHEVTVDTTADLVTVKKLDLVAELLTARTQGTVRDYRKQATLDLKGTYSGSWERLTILLHELAPATAEVIALSGALAGDFKVSGPASQPKIVPTYRGVEGGCRLGWGGGKAMGLDIGKAELVPTFKDAQLLLPATAIPMSGGQLRLGGTVDLRGEAPTFSLPGETKMMEGIQINKEFGKLFLSYINPVFASVTDLQGDVSMTVKDVALPLGEQIKTSGSAQGRLDISSMKLRPAGIFGTLLEYGSVITGPTAQLYDVQLSPVDFTLSKGRISYDNFAMTFPGGFDLKFRGSVGFDDTVDLWVSLPIRAGLFKKLGVKGPVEEYARVLGAEKARIEIPIIGKRLHPELGNVEIKPIVEKALKALLRDKLPKIPKLPGGILDKLRIPGKKPTKDKPKPGLLEGLGKKLGAGLGGADKKEPQK